MKARFVRDSLTESYHSDDDESVEITDSPFDEGDNEYDDEIIISNEFESSLDNELKVPEYARRTVSFRVKGEPGIIDAVPMAKMKDGSFLMKTDGKYRKFKIQDIIEESFK